MRYKSKDPIDPLSQALAPPPGETVEQRTVREHDEGEARKRSAMIDEQLRAERTTAKKQPVKVLMLGQSESGKSTTVKNFLITHANQAWLKERESWRAVIHLNMISMVNQICRIMGSEMEMANAEGTQQGGGQSWNSRPNAYEDDDSRAPSPVQRAAGRSGSSASTPLEWTDVHYQLKSDLSPLIQTQSDLEAWLGQAVGSIELEGPAAPFADQEVKDTLKQRRNPMRPREFFVRSVSSWKAAFRSMGSSNDPGNEESTRKMKQIVKTISSLKEPMVQLWADPVVQAMLSSRQMRLQEQSGFFMDDISRIAGQAYEPTDYDAVHARLRTMGVQTYSFTIDSGQDKGCEWKMYDVGGIRSRRAAWYPYFMDVNAIIFMAPISVFDEQLEEDQRVNRLEDSYILWKGVCSSKLLAKVQLILFLNKCDMLQTKLQRGVEVRRFVPTYGDRPNILPAVAKYFRSQFRDILRNSLPESRGFYSFLTSVTDTQSTAVVIDKVREGIMRNQLQDAELI